jgi:hypothetical protein
VEEDYVVSGHSFDTSELSSSSIERYREQRDLDNYSSSMPSRPAHYISDEDTSSGSGYGFKNLVWD